MLRLGILTLFSLLMFFQTSLFGATQKDSPPSRTAPERKVHYQIFSTYLGQKDSLKLPPACYLDYTSLYYKLFTLALANYQPNQYQLSGKLVFSFSLDSGSRLICNGLVTGVHPKTDSAFLRFAKHIVMTGYEKGVGFELPFYINVDKAKTNGKDTLDLWNLWRFEDIKFNGGEIPSKVIIKESKFPFSWDVFQEYMIDHLIVPMEMQENEAESNVTVLFESNEQGKISGVVLLKSGNSGFDSLWFAEVKRVVRQAPRMVPANACGLNLKTFHLLQVECRISS